MSQRGFSLVELAIYAGIAIAVMGAIAGVIYAWNSFIDGIDDLGYKRGKSEVRAELAPQLATCKAQSEEQSRAVEALATEGARKAQEASKALAKAEGRARVWDEQAKRLQDVLTRRKPTDDNSCGAAWAELRK